MGNRIGLISKLVDEKSAGFLGNAFGNILIIIGVALTNIRSREAHIRAQGFKMENFFLCHLIGHNDGQLISFLLGHQGQSQAGIACRGFYDLAARL